MHNNNRPHASASTPSPSSKFLPDLPSPSDLCDTKDIENHPATQVLPHLYLGNMRDASDMASLSRLNIRYVLNVTAKQPSYHLPPGFHYKHLEAADNGLQNLRQFFEEAFNFIDEAKKAGAGVLVHCQAGISRSPTIAVAYLMKHYPMAMADAYKFVKTKRSIISPNLNFMGQLWEFEQVLNDEAKESGLKSGSSTASVVASNTNTFMWSQSNDVSKTVDGIYASPAAMNGCSVWEIEEKTLYMKHIPITILELRPWRAGPDRLLSKFARSAHMACIPAIGSQRWAFEFFPYYHFVCVRPLSDLFISVYNGVNTTYTYMLDFRKI